MRTVAAYQSMEAGYERGLIRLRSLKHQRWNVLLLINYCLQCVCIHAHIYSVLGASEEKVIYLAITTSVIMIGDFFKGFF